MFVWYNKMPNITSTRGILIMKKVVIATIGLLSFTGVASAGCPSGTFGIYINNNFDNSIKAQVQDFKTGQALTPVSRELTPTNGETLCFSQDHDKYKLMQYRQTTNLQYDLDKKTIIARGYFMNIFATDSNFHPAG